MSYTLQSDKKVKKSKLMCAENEVSVKRHRSRPGGKMVDAICRKKGRSRSRSRSKKSDKNKAAAIMKKIVKSACSPYVQAAKDLEMDNDELTPSQTIVFPSSPSSPRSAPSSPNASQSSFWQNLGNSAPRTLGVSSEFLGCGDDDDE